VLTLAQGHIANCYIVNPGTAENPTTSGPIPIARARQYGGMPAEAEVHLDILWDDNGVINTTDAPPTLNGSSFRVTTTGKHGNAGIALRDNTTNDIYWSWHIWVTDYDPSIPENTWTNTDNPVYVFMDRNLGALDNTHTLASRGFLYQWGRKDPFPGGRAGMAGYSQLDKFQGLEGDATPVDNSLDGGNLQSIRNPTRFYANNYGGWQNGNPDTWQNATNTKTVYDPCPPGWCVPTCNKGGGAWPFMGYTGTGNAGETESAVSSTNANGKIIRFPFAGYRNIAGIYSFLPSNYPHTRYHTSWRVDQYVRQLAFGYGYDFNPWTWGVPNTGSCVRCVKEN
jgi:hypothetical protein